jgi:FMN hydrolase / 5-amino-6-(5-phospho-D-ribitylamino)uracil phosphatase
MSLTPLRPFDPSPRAIFFDLDDTLCDYASARQVRLRIAFAIGLESRSLGGGAELELDRMLEESIEMHPHGAEHFADLFRRHGVSDARAASIAADWYRSNRFHGLQLFPETIEVVDAVRRSGVAGSRPIGVITNGPLEVQKAKVDLLQINDLADFVIISEDFGVAKPDPAIFREALRRAGVPAHEAVFVGDSAEFDIAGAHAAGMHSVWLNRSGTAWADALTPPCREIRSLRQLPMLIAELL